MSNNSDKRQIVTLEKSKSHILSLKNTIWLVSFVKSSSLTYTIQFKSCYTITIIATNPIIINSWKDMLAGSCGSTSTTLYGGDNYCLQFLRKKTVRKFFFHSVYTPKSFLFCTITADFKTWTWSTLFLKLSH